MTRKFAIGALAFMLTIVIIMIVTIVVILLQAIGIQSIMFGIAFLIIWAIVASWLSTFLTDI